MAEQHTAEPWECVVIGKSIVVRSCDGHPITVVMRHLEDARRIVAAVNACKGLTTVELERIDIGGLNKIVIALEATLPPLK